MSEATEVNVNVDTAPAEEPTGNEGQPAETQGAPSETGEGVQTPGE